MCSSGSLIGFLGKEAGSSHELGAVTDETSMRESNSCTFDALTALNSKDLLGPETVR